MNWKDRDPDSKPWVYTDEDYGYTNVLSWERVIVGTEVETHVGEQEVIFYLSATEADDIVIDVAAGIKVPGVGDFNISEKGTDTLNGPEEKIGAIFNHPHFVHVSADKPIDYSKQDSVKLRIETKDENPIDGIKIKKINGLDDVIYFNGISKQKNVLLIVLIFMVLKLLIL